MGKLKSLTKNPTLLTAALSLAAVAGYVTYRLTVPADVAAPETGNARQAIIDLEADNGEPLYADALPDIVINDLDGKPTPLSTWTGKAMVINFWATWCGPCRQEIPLLKSLSDTSPSVQVVGIAVDDLAPVRDYAEDAKFNYPILVGGVGAGIEAMVKLHNEGQAIPFSVFTAPDGAVLALHTGPLSADQIDDFTATVEALDAGRIDRETARARLAGLL